MLGRQRYFDDSVLRFYMVVIAFWERRVNTEEFKFEKYLPFVLFWSDLSQSWVILRKCFAILHKRVCQIVSTISEFYSTPVENKPKWAQNCQYLKFIFLFAQINAPTAINICNQQWIPLDWACIAYISKSLNRSLYCLTNQFAQKLFCV